MPSPSARSQDLFDVSPSRELNYNIRILDVQDLCKGQIVGMMEGAARIFQS